MFAYVGFFLYLCAKLAQGQVRGGVLATIKREKFIAMQQQKDGASGVSGASNVVSQLTERQLHIIKFIAENPLLSVKKLA